MSQTKLTSRTGETPDAKSKRMAVEVPQRIIDQRKASEAVYGVVKPADEQPRRAKSLAAQKAKAAEAKPKA
jgi:hypothetical protein